MGFHLTESPSGESHPTAKNRVRGFFGEQPNLRREKSAATKQPRQGNPSTTTKLASGVRYYGYRYYLPELGKWPSRDPIGERGGINLYGMVRNRITSQVDSLGRVPVDVNYTPPCPHCLVPVEANALQVSHTDYPDNKKKCSCECVCPDRDSGQWFIRCTVSFEAIIYLSSQEIGINGATWSTIYGHEQQHIVSRTGLVQTVVDEISAKNGGPFDSSSKCDNSRREWQFDLCNKFRDQLDPKKNPPHRGDVGPNNQQAAHDAPGNGQPIEPLPGTHEDIVSGLENLDNIGYGK
ncbi:RHS repeat-associated core domain-containing protein [Verrucomicrobiaceae bacterium 227]